MYPNQGQYEAPPCLTIEHPVPNSHVNIPFNLKNRNICIIGTIDPEAYRFDINLCNQQNRIALHISIRCGQEAIVRNTNLQGWGREERGLPSRFPFAKNSPFQIEIAVDHEAYHFKLNGVHQFAYIHRFRPINQVRSLQVTAGASINEISFY